MKQIFLTTISVLIALFATAQTTDVQIATLQHGDETTIFTGVNAFVDAYNAAADSADIITLSSGVFNSTTIKKQICVYGAGHTADTITGIMPTIIASDIRLEHGDCLDKDGYNVKAGIKVDNSHFEGLYFANDFSLHKNTTEIKNVVINKCIIARHFQLLSKTSNISVVNCIVKGQFRGNEKHNNLYIANSVLSHIGADYAGERISGTVCIDHCIFNNWQGNFSVSNSIVLGGNAERGGSTLENNIFVEGIPANVTQNKVNWSKVPLTAIFEEGTYEDDKWLNGDCILKNPDKYIGNDGTQVGIYGGFYPFGKIPSIPRIIESKIDTETSADGKLKVSIKAQAQTK